MHSSLVTKNKSLRFTDVTNITFIESDLTWAVTSVWHNRSRAWISQNCSVFLTDFPYSSLPITQQGFPSSWTDFLFLLLKLSLSWVKRVVILKDIEHGQTFFFLIKDIKTLLNNMLLDFLLRINHYRDDVLMYTPLFKNKDLGIPALAMHQVNGSSSNTSVFTFNPQRYSPETHYHKHRHCYHELAWNVHY